MPVSHAMNRRAFLKGSLAASAAGAVGLQAGQGRAADAPAGPPAPAPADALPQGKIGDLQVSRILLGGNLLTHFTHSRDLKYVYNLTAHYNTEEKICETLALAEQHGVNTLSVHNPPAVMAILRKYRRERGGKIRWIVCPTAPADDAMETYAKAVDQLVGEGADAIYVWGVRADQLVAQGRVDLIAKAVEIAKAHGVPSGVGGHDLRVVMECEKQNVGADFYIKTFHHHKYPSGPKPEEIKGPYNEFPGYWCSDPEATAEFMKGVRKPWIAFKVMAAGAILPEDAFRFAFTGGADHVLAGMFDFEIAEDVGLAKKVLSDVTRARPWRS